MIDDLQFEDCHDMQQLSAALKAYSTSLGLPYFSYFLVSGSDEEEEVFLSNYRQNWLDRYLRKSYQHYDPVIVTSRNARLPFFWNQKTFLSPFRKIQKRVFYEAREFSISAGYSIPIRGPNNDLGVFSIVSSGDQDLVEAVRHEGSKALLVAMQAHDRAMVICADTACAQQTPDLSPRELECIKWTAEGKTSDEIADIISISAATVNYHINKVISKLAAANRHHAAIIAVRKKII